MLELEQFTAVVHLKRTLKVLLTDKPEIVSNAFIVTRIVEPVSVELEEFIVNVELPKTNQDVDGVADHTMSVAIPTGFVTIVGRTTVRDVPIQ